MQILFVCAEVPTPQHIRSHGLLHALAGKGHQITVVCGAAPGSHEQIADLWERGVRVIAVPQSESERRQNMLRALPGPLPLRAAAAFGPGLLAAVRNEARSGTYDVAHVDGIAASALGHALADMPAVLDAAGCASMDLARRSRQGWQHGARVALDLARTRRHERAYLASYERVVAASADDAWALRMLGQTADAHAPAVHVVPTPITPGGVAGILALREQETLLICADREGRDTAARQIIEQVMPQIWHDRADIRLLVAGPLPTRMARGGAIDPRILSVGADDLRAIARATIALAPGGAHAADSALQALGAGTPLIASRMIGRALGAADGRDMLLADEPTELAQAILGLLDDPRYRGQIGRGGRAHVEQRHAPDLVARELEQIYAAARGISIADWNLTMGLSHMHSREVGGS